MMAGALMVRGRIGSPVGFWLLSHRGSHRGEMAPLVLQSRSCSMGAAGWQGKE